MKRPARSTILVFALVALLLTSAGSAWSQQPETPPQDSAETPLAPAAPTRLLFSYQGQLDDSAGNPITNPALAMTFRLYTVATGGTACWSENQTVDVQDGLFNVLLGQTTAIDPDDCLIGNAYLELRVNGEVLSPREVLASVTHAAEASTLTAGATTRGDVNVLGDFSMTGDTLHINTDSSPTDYVSKIRFHNNDYITYDDTTLAPGSFSFDADGNPGSAFLQAGGATFRRIGVGTDPDPDVGSVTTSGAIRMILPSGGMSALTTPSGHPGIRMKSNTSNYSADIVRYDDYLALAVNDTTSIPSTRLSIMNDGKVGIGTSNPEAKLDVQGDVNVTGDLTLGGTCSLVSARGVTGDDSLIAATDDCSPGSIISGAYIEANLQTPEERSSKNVTRFERGDVLCWLPEAKRLELCASANDRLVMAVADASGKPIVVGAEPIKVLGPVQAGDILVSSHVAGYAMVNNEPKPGTVIAQALEDLDDEAGAIKAMIRKW